MILTHQKIDETISGKCVDIINGKRSIVVLKTQDFMKVDDKGLVHGGFTFSLADHAAMVAVNHPNVVLYKANVKFQAPVKVGDTLVAKARVYRKIKNRHFVEVQVFKEDKIVFVGKFLCIILESHVLDLRK